jgi:excisionase family DNA binding protein
MNSRFAASREAIKSPKLRSVPPPLDPLQRYRPEEAAAYLRVSRWSVFQDIREGRLASIKEGRRRFIPGSELVRRSQAA